MVVLVAVFTNPHTILDRSKTAESHRAKKNLGSSRDEIVSAASCSVNLASPKHICPGKSE
ncbi:hypothetical protein N7540_011971 [Penicillium herquei]|nr:hypothetical protein N7540_011971 [Penicillium herquei]